MCTAENSSISGYFKVSLLYLAFPCKMNIGMECRSVFAVRSF